MSIQLLTPGASDSTAWTEITEPSRKGTSGQVGYESRVIARWVEKYCDDYTSTRRVALAIWHAGAVEGYPPKATVYAAKFDPTTGTAYQPGTPVVVTDWEYDSTFAWDTMADPVTGDAATRGAWMYFVDLATLDSDGMVELRAVCEPHDSSAGYSRVLQGYDVNSSLTPPRRDRSEMSLLLNSKAVSATANRTTIYVDPVSGNNSNDGTEGSPKLTIAGARTVIRTNQSLSTNAQTNMGGGTILLKAGTYTPADESTFIYNYNAPLIIKAAPGVARSSVIIQISNWRHRAVNLRFENVTIQPLTTGAARLMSGESATSFTKRGGGTGDVQANYFVGCEISNSNVIVLSDPFTGDHLGLGITNATYTASTRTITKTGAFASYTFVSGNTIRFTDTATSTTYQCQVASKTSNDAIVLTASPSSSTGLQAAPLADIADLSTTPYKYWPTNIKPNNAVQFYMFGCYVHHWHDTASVTACQIVHNCYFENVANNGPNPDGHFTYVRVHTAKIHTATPGIHVDAMQYSKTGTVGAPHDSNSLVLNFAAWNIYGQGWHHEGSRHNIAIVNGFIARASPQTNNLNIIGSNNSEDQSLKHFCVVNLTMLGYNNLLWSDPGTGATHTGSDMITKGCLLDSALSAYYIEDSFEVNISDVSQTSATKDANYTSASGYDASVSFGYSDLTLIPTLANYPVAGLGTTSRSIPFDLARQSRAATTARGAFALATEYAAAAATTHPSLLLLFMGS